MACRIKSPRTDRLAKATADDFGNVATALQAQLGRLDGLVHTAALLGSLGPIEHQSFDSWLSLLRVNVAAPMILSRLFAQATRRSAAQRLVVNISSGAAKRPIAGWSAYCAAKAALEMATRVAALEASTIDPTLAICSLAPGVVDTDMQGLIRGTNEQQFPDVAKFCAMKADGVLRSAHDVAREIIGLIADNRLTNGGNFDIRELAP